MEHDRRDEEKLDEAVEDMRSDAEGMQERSEKLGDRIEHTRSDWHRKQQDDAVPGCAAAAGRWRRAPAQQEQLAAHGDQIGVGSSHDSDSSSSPSAAISSRFAK